MIPKKLSLSGFLSYREPVEVDFTRFDLACISGANGAGKSSLLDAMTWALFGQARKRDDSVINTQSETAEVSFIFEYEHNTYRVERAKPRDKGTSLEFQIELPGVGWKPLTERTLRATEARIEETLRLDYETFVNASFFLQGKADQFTQQRPGDRKRILSSILGLEVWESYRKETVERRKLIDANIAELDGRLQEINAELAEEDERKARLEELQDQLDTLSKGRAAQENALAEMRRRQAALQEQQKLVETLAGQLARAQTALDNLNTKLAEREEEKATFADIIAQEKEIEAAHKTWQETQAELERWNEVAERFREHEKRRQQPLTEIETGRARLETELENLKNQQQSVTAAEATLAELQSKQTETAAAVKALETQLAERAKLEEQLSEAVKQQAEARAENPRLRAEMEELKARITQLEQTDGAVCPLCGQPLNAEERAALIASLTTQGTEMGDRYRANTAMLKEADALVSDLEKQIAGFAQQEENARAQTREFDQIANQIETISTQQGEWAETGAPRLAEVEAALEKADFAPEARTALAEIDAELKEIGYDAASHDAVRQAESEQRTAETELRALENARAALAPLEREINDLQGQITEQTKEVARQQDEHDTAAASLAQAQEDAPDVDAAAREMLDMQQKENQLRLEVGAAQQKVLVLDDLKERKTELESQREEYARQVGLYKSLERAFSKDGVPAMLIEQALPQIEAKANEVLERLSGGNMSIRFITQAAYKDSKREDMKETLDIQISDSAGMRDYEMYSGGEAFRINFAIRLALSEVLAQRAGARLQTLVIDEGFGSQDEMGRQRLVEAINTVKNDFAKILVITHIDSLKDAFPNRIEVDKTPLGSSVRVV